ncbi:acyl-CoA dehydrogenase family protein [Streptomyces sp. NPDC054784]
MPVNGENATPPPAGHERPDWPHIAREIADDLATDAVVREQAGKAPLDEVARLREAGLLALLVPAERGGGGADWRTAHAVLRTVTAADGALGHLLGNHYFLSTSARHLASPARAERVERRSAAGQWCWGGGLAGREPPLTLVPTSDGYLLGGSRRHVTGVAVADRLAVRAVRSGTDEPLAVLVDPAHPGVTAGGGGDTFGQRLAAGGAVEFDEVPVAADDVLGSLSPDEGILSPYACLAAPTARLVSAQFCLGVAEGLLAEVREYERLADSPWAEPAWRPPAAVRPWPDAVHPWPDGPGGSERRDPYAVALYGELAVAVRAAAALADQALGALEAGLARGEDLDDDECAEIAVLAGAAEAAAARAAQDGATRALDVVGADAAAARHGFDRFWRDARTHTLREPVAHRLREVGDYFLHGSHPPFTLPA